jgi:hypothetical protein
MWKVKQSKSGAFNGDIKQAKVYEQARRLARAAAPAMMAELIQLAETAQDERVRSVCLIAVLDRGGLRPIEQDPFPVTKAPFDARAYSSQELEIIETALKLIKERRGRDQPSRPVPEILAPQPKERVYPDDDGN